MAGYMSYDSNWEIFASRWSDLLIRRKLPFVHLKEWSNLCKDNNWTNDYGNNVLLEFVEIITECKLIGIGVGVDATEWRALSAKRRHQFGDAQQFCFQRIVRKVMDRVFLVKPNEPIALVFDRDYEFAARRINLLRHFHNHYPEIAINVASVSFANSALYLPLQAADLLAWETRRHLINAINGNPTSKRLMALLEKAKDIDVDYDGELWHKGNIDKALSDVETNIRVRRTNAGYSG
jgi:hypothetical protein